MKWLIKKTHTFGFTLVELLVVVAIFMVVSGLVIFNYSNFRSTVSLENLAQDIALTVRKAQVFALGVKGVNAQFPGYGIHINLDSATTTTTTSVRGNSKSFIFFADIPLSPGTPGAVGDKQYNMRSGIPCDGSSLGAGNECVDIVTITTPDEIRSICTSASTCYTSGSLDIVFTRPNPEASICYIPSSGIASCSNSHVDIIVAAQDGTTKSVTVWNTGQISTK